MTGMANHMKLNQGLWVVERVIHAAAAVMMTSVPHMTEMRRSGEATRRFVL